MRSSSRNLSSSEDSARFGFPSKQLRFVSFNGTLCTSRRSAGRSPLREFTLFACAPPRLAVILTKYRWDSSRPPEARAAYGAAGLNKLRPERKAFCDPASVKQKPGKNRHVNEDRLTFSNWPSGGASLPHVHRFGRELILHPAARRPARVTECAGPRSLSKTGLARRAAFASAAPALPSGNGGNSGYSPSHRACAGPRSTSAAALVAYRLARKNARLRARVAKNEGNGDGDGQNLVRVRPGLPRAVRNREVQAATTS